MIANSSTKCPRKVVGSFGAEAISLTAGLDRGIGIAFLADELVGWSPLPLVPSVTPVIGLTDGESVITYLLGNKSTGLERRLLGYLAWNRCVLRSREVVAVAQALRSPPTAPAA